MLGVPSSFFLLPSLHTASILFLSIYLQATSKMYTHTIIREATLKLEYVFTTTHRGGLKSIYRSTNIYHLCEYQVRISLGLCIKASSDSCLHYIEWYSL